MHTFHEICKKLTSAQEQIRFDLGILSVAVGIFFVFAAPQVSPATPPSELRVIETDVRNGGEGKEGLQLAARFRDKRGKMISGVGPQESLSYLKTAERRGNEGVEEPCATLARDSLASTEINLKEVNCCQGNLNFESHKGKPSEDAACFRTRRHCRAFPCSIRARCTRAGVYVSGKIASMVSEERSLLISMERGQEPDLSSQISDRWLCCLNGMALQSRGVASASFATDVGKRSGRRNSAECGAVRVRWEGLDENFGDHFIEQCQDGVPVVLESLPYKDLLYSQRSDGEGKLCNLGFPKGKARAIGLHVAVGRAWSGNDQTGDSRRWIRRMGPALECIKASEN
ncbi:hypothetical protein K438DRAFT_1778157 [Mycena galopus ATCC 62051]|nr:hypothetical protein K438DRAFT_1778157 [Mycena galopus ATCC 62051]